MAQHPNYNKIPTQSAVPSHNPFSSTTSSYTWGAPSDSKSFYTPGKKIIRQNREFLKKRRDLPIYPWKAEILARIEKSQVVVIEGETGSGKSTQIPQWCLELPNVSRVVCTQPRRIAAISLAHRVAHEMGVALGDDVGYVVRFDNKSSKDTSLKYVTDGIIMRQIMSDRMLDSYDVILIDEVHERRMVTDLLLGLVKQILPFRPELRIVVMSATLNMNLFCDFFGNCDHMNIPGKLFPIEKVFWPAVIERAVFSPDDAKRLDRYVIHAINVVMEICISARIEGDILVFVTGRDEIDYICGRLKGLISNQYSQSVGQIEIIPLYGELPYSSQQRIFAAAPPSYMNRISRKCIVATNIAETSITIEGIVFVVDSGRVKLSNMDKNCHTKSLLPVPISQSSAEQRAGRAGRTQPGKCFRLYKEEDYEAMAKDTLPEILRGDLTSDVLRLKTIDIDLATFESIDQPDLTSLQLSLVKLKKLDAINEQCNLTKIGEQMANFPLDVEVARMLVASKKYSCQKEILTLAALLSGDRPGSVFPNVGKDTRDKALARRQKFFHPLGDHLTFINVYNQFVLCADSEEWCFENFVNFKILNEASMIYEHLESIMLKLGLMDSSYHSKAIDANVLKALLTGNINNIAQKKSLSEKREFVTVQGKINVTLHPSCCLETFHSQHKVVTYSTCLKTTSRQPYISTVSAVEEEWYQEVALDTGAPPLPKLHDGLSYLLAGMRLNSNPFGYI